MRLVSLCWYFHESVDSALLGWRVSGVVVSGVSDSKLVNRKN